MIEVKDALIALADREVDFVLIGGVALSLHSAAYVTYDIDVCYSRDRKNLVKIADALRPFHPRLRGFPKELPFIWDAQTLLNGTLFTLETDLGDFDLLAEVSGVGSYNDVREMSERWEIFGRPFNILSVDGLIATKEAANREKDIPGLKLLYALKDSIDDKN